MIDLIGSSCIKPYCVIDRQSYCAKVLLKRPPLSMKEQRRETRVTHAAVDIVATAGR